MIADSKGLRICLKYAFPPNSYHYCGPERQKDVNGYLTEGVGDPGLAEILYKFDTLYKYLVLIAANNNIMDPFDRRVVEAYWIGNSLLDSVSRKKLVDHLTDSLKLKKRISGATLHPVLDKVSDAGFPHHNFHVLNIFVRTGHYAIAHTLETMDSCRISWGKVIDEELRIKNKEFRINGANGKRFFVNTAPLVYQHRTIELGPSTRKLVTSLANDPKVGDWVSLHWGFVCDVISGDQVRRLSSFTRQALAVANRSL